MRAETLAEYFENDADGSVSDSEVAYTLRKQHEAINVLREALNFLLTTAHISADIQAKQALKDTEEIAKWKSQ